MDLRGKKYIDEGTYGRCYELSNNDILKIFKIPKGKYDIKKLKQFSKIQTKTIAFPKELLVSGNTLFGYSMRKVPGKELYENFRNYNLEEAAFNTVNLENDIINLSKLGIKMYDIHSENVFYDGHNYSVIDTDEYDLLELNQDYINEDYLLYLNIKQFYSMFIELFISELFYLGYYFNQHDILCSKLKSYKIKDYELNQLINMLKQEVEKYFSFKIDKLSDLEKLKRR